MVKQSPKIDPRTAADIEQQVQELLINYFRQVGQDWPKLQIAPESGKVEDKGISVALIKIFARYCEIIIERLNKVPEKNFLAFLDLLGASHLPPQSARVPLTFSLATGTTVDAVVPKGTQVVAQLAADEKQPVIFETENELVVTAAKLESIFVRDPQQDRYADYSTIITTIASDDFPVFRGRRSMDELRQVSVPIENVFTNNAAIDLSTDFFPFGQQPKFGDTFYFANSKIFSQNREKFTLKIDLTPPDKYSNQSEVTASSNLSLQWDFWNGEKWQQLGIPGQVPGTITEFTDTTSTLRHSGQIEFKLDRKPEFTKVNGIENYWVRVRIASGKYEISTSDTPPVIHSVPPVISSISYVVATQIEESITPSLSFGFTLPPNHKDFLQKPISLFISLAEPKYNEKSIPLSPTQSRQFGSAGTTVVHQFDVTNDTTSSVSFQPSISGATWETVVSLSPIKVEAGTTKQLEVQVKIPAGTALNSTDRGHLQLKTDDPLRVDSADFETFVGAELPELKQPQLSWEYWNGEKWSKLTVSDATENFTRSGVITFLPPKDFTPREDFGLLLRYWLRVRWEGGDYLVEPKLRRVQLNTVMATQAVTIRNEILGSSDGSENQKFRTTRMPVLRGQQLEVRESEMPSAQDRENIKRDEGNDAIAPILNANGHPTKECWVRWHEVPDFYASGSRDRHYIINHLTGEIQFGNGRNGLIPSLSKNNIRMAYYQTGGGEAGNKPAGTIVQLKTTIPYVNQVTNHEAATGGAEAETVEAMIERIPRRIRHHDRAVTLEDYEDLAREASAEVARAKCFPLRNLAENPLDETKVTGTVSVIIVPQSTDGKPLPTLELIGRVQDYLEARIDPTVNIVVVGPLYVEVKITTELVLTSLENGSMVEQNVEKKLASFLHPLTGGFDGTGWDFGRQPYQSDLYRLLEGVPGIDHVHYLTVTSDYTKPDTIPEDIRKILKTNRFLVYSGKHEIRLTFAKA